MSRDEAERTVPEVIREHLLQQYDEKQYETHLRAAYYDWEEYKKREKLATTQFQRRWRRTRVDLWEEFGSGNFSSEIKDPDSTPKNGREVYLFLSRAAEVLESSSVEHPIDKFSEFYYSLVKDLHKAALGFLAHLEDQPSNFLEQHRLGRTSELHLMSDAKLFEEKINNLADDVEYIRHVVDTALKHGRIEETRSNDKDDQQYLLFDSELKLPALLERE